jgi:hypothetical protein
MWNSTLARAVISDDMNVSVGGSIVGLIGMGGSFNVTLLTRGKDAGIHFNRTLSYKVGAELGAGIGFSRGWFVGNAQNGTYGDLLGSGAEAGGDIGVGVAGWASFNGEAGVRMFGETISIGPQIGASGGLTKTTDGWW